MDDATKSTDVRLKRAQEIANDLAELPAGECFRQAQARCGDDRELLDDVMQALGQRKTAVIARPSAEAPPDDLVNQKVGPYKIHWRLGGGGNGDVYLATRVKEPRQQLAIKFLRLTEGDNDEFRRRFLRERQIVALLNHPNIVKLFDADRARNGRPYFAMEYVDGETLDKYCDTKRLTVTQRLEIFLTVCDAIQYLHTHLIVHRDMKPENVMVGADGIPKVLDFGIAKLLRPGLLDGEPVTLQMHYLMTPEYASPEQWKLGAITSASDVYSLGVVLFRLLTGRVPFPTNARSYSNLAEYGKVVCSETAPAASASIVAAHAQNCREQSAEDLARCLAGDLDAILAKALEKDPGERYVSVASFADDIRRHLTFVPVEARKGVTTYRLSRFMRRNRQLVASLAAVFVALAVGLGLALQQWARANHNRDLAVQSLGQARAAGQLLAQRLDQVQTQNAETRAGSLEEVAKALADRGDYVSITIAKDCLRTALEDLTAAGAAQKAQSVKTLLGDLERRNVDRPRGAQPEVSLHPADNAALGRSYQSLGQLLAAAGDNAGARDAYMRCAAVLSPQQCQDSGKVQ